MSHPHRAESGKARMAARYGSPSLTIRGRRRSATSPSLQRERRPYTYVGGGPGSGIWKSIDGGDTWTKLTEGLPKGDVGRIGLDVSRSSPNIIYATIETKVTGNGASQGNTEASIYRSDDRGASWQKTGTAFSYPWYMGQIRVDPTDPERSEERRVGKECRSRWSPY